MDYELAKRLKDNGFPRKYYRCSYCIEQDYESCTECEDAVESNPSLEELIEACGDRFILLERRNGYYKNGRSRPVRWVCEDLIISCASGSTPSEAVANLWLALNVDTPPKSA